MSQTNGRDAEGEPDPERLLDLAARMVVAGRMPSVARLARAYPCSEHYVLLARSHQVGLRRWPYRTRRLMARSGPLPAEVLAARLRLGLPPDDGPAVALPVTPAALACLQYRREWIEGVNFLDRHRRPGDEDE